MSTYPAAGQSGDRSDLADKIVKRLLQVGLQLLILATALFLSSWVPRTCTVPRPARDCVAQCPLTLALLAGVR